MPVQIVQILTEPDLLPKLQYLLKNEHGLVTFEVSYVYRFTYFSIILGS